MKKLQIICCLVLTVGLLVRCAKNAPDIDTDFRALPLTATAPADNPQTTQKIALGKLLFWDPVLSGRKDVACATCHHPALGFSDGLDLSIGVNGQGLGTGRHFLLPNNIPFARRNSPSVVNTAFNGINTDGNYDAATAPMFFDNRTRSLEAQSLEPIKTMEEMRGPAISPTSILDTVVQRLRAIPQYVQVFGDVFGPGTAVTMQNAAKAMAAYERSLLSNHSPYDEHLRGNTAAMTATQIQGMNAFASNGCNKCHSGPMFSDYAVHVLSAPDNPKLPTDAGAGNYAFRTPSLRNLSSTAPYMHSGAFAVLTQVLDFYERIGDGRSQNAHVTTSQLDGNLQRLNERDKASIIQFLSALNDTSFDKGVPASVPSGLRPGGNL